MSDLINRAVAIELIERMKPYHQDADDIAEMIANMPSAQPEERTEERTETHACASISRQAAIDKFIDGLEEIFADLRERHVDDSVCGLCEYDGAYIGQSGDWCNECPGFDKDDCFKLSDKIRKEWADEIIKALTSAQTEIVRCKDCKHHHRDNSGAYYCGRKDYGYGWGLNDFCSDAERREE